MLISFHVIHLYVPEGCSVLAAKTSLKTRSEGFSETHLYKKSNRQERRWITFPTLFTCLIMVIWIAPTKLWMQKNAPFGDTGLSPNFLSDLWAIAQFFEIHKSFTSPKLLLWLREWQQLGLLEKQIKINSSAHLTADYRRALESMLLTGTETIINTLRSLNLIIHQLHTHRLSSHRHFWEIINGKPDNHW